MLYQFLSFCLAVKTEFFHACFCQIEQGIDTPFSIVQQQEIMMPRGDKSAYTDKQKRQAQHIEESYEQRGVPAEEAKRRAWATENKVSGGGKKSGSGRKTSHH
jgi:hypothetical protein